MSIKADVSQLDHHLEFLRYEVSNLRKMDKPWAEAKANKMEQIMVVLSDVRRDKQMTGINGKRIDG